MIVLNIVKVFVKCNSSGPSERKKRNNSKNARECCVLLYRFHLLNLVSHKSAATRPVSCIIKGWFRLNTSPTASRFCRVTGVLPRRLLRKSFLLQASEKTQRSPHRKYPLAVGSRHSAYKSGLSCIIQAHCMEEV